MTEENIQVLKKWIEERKNTLAEIASMYNSLFDGIRSEAKLEKKRFRNLEIISFIKDFINQQIVNWTSHHLGKSIELSSSFDWESIELFVNTFATFYQELSLSGMKYQPNDVGDLHNLVYVRPNDKYWTKETRWLKIIRKLDHMEHYLKK